MQRPITAFAQDSAGDWFATLSCGHTQHTRHQPPFQSRPWVTTEEGRQSKLGEMLECPYCERMELPEHFIAFHQTPEFTEATIPAGLLKDHTTKPGVWAKILVTEGTLRYHVDGLSQTFELVAGTVGIVVPEVLHYVEPLGPVRFSVEFYHAPGAAR
jgi:tellurite methyltransferase